MERELTEHIQSDDDNDGRDVADPFAVDLFAASRAHESHGTRVTDGRATIQAADPQATPPAETRSWDAALPRMSRDDARRSAALAALPPSLKVEAREALVGVLARLARVSARDVQVAVVGVLETAISRIAQRPVEGEAARAFVSVNIEPEGAPIALALDAEFASALADRLLGGEGSPPNTLRSLSPTERAVVEFFSLAVVHELNVIAGEPLLRLEAVTNDLPPKFLARLGPPIDASAASSDTAEARVLVATLRVAIESTMGLVRLVFNDEALAALSVIENPLLVREREGLRKKIEDFRRFTDGAPLRILVGETGLDARSLAELDQGDVVLISVELPAGRISLEELSRLRVGQVLELGCRASDPVELVADGRRVAAGELVDIEGRLGVRITRLS
jgi:flagellar motor switch/type III secretory pathway protein FliN